MGIGVVAISYNEERDLPGFIANLSEWVDEIVIVDDGSTDNTADLAQHPKVKFIHSPRNEGEYYADQRNKGIDASSSDWLLHMDIDERVPQKLIEELRAEISRDQKKAYRFRRTNYFLHRPMKGGGWADWNLVHLAKRECLRFGGMFHETIELTCEPSEIGQLKTHMIHLNDESYIERLGKSNNYQHEVAASIRKSAKRLTASGLIMSFVKEFVKKYVFKKGFLDGSVGLLSAMHSATAAFRSYAIVWDEQHRIERSDLEKSIE